MARFAERGYESVSVRSIAAAAGVDAALVHHYYGTKRDLYAATLATPPEPTARTRDALAGSTLGEALVREFLDDATHGAGLASLMRAAGSDPRAQRRLAETIETTILGPASATVDPKARLPKLRAALVAAQLIGLAWIRYVQRTDPIASASPAMVARTFGPSIDVTLSRALDPS